MGRKKLLADTITETPSLAVSRYIEINGSALYRAAEEKGLEGVVSVILGAYKNCVLAYQSHVLWMFFSIISTTEKTDKSAYPRLRGRCLD